MWTITWSTGIRLTCVTVSKIKRKWRNIFKVWLRYFNRLIKKQWYFTQRLPLLTNVLLFSALMLHFIFGILYDSLSSIKRIQQADSCITQKGHFSCAFKEKAYAVFCLKKNIFYGITGMKTEGNILEKLHEVMLLEKSSYLKEQLHRYLWLCLH